MGKKILTIDDSQTVRMIIAKHLSQFPVQILEAENGEAGVACARANQPNLILLDYNMPVMDGYHTLVELRSDAALKPVPVVMVTTETAKETVIKLLKLGLNDYIAKPFTRELLLKKINPLLKLYEGDTVPVVEPARPAPSAAQTDAAVAAPAARRLMLAVDDKAGVRELLKEYLSEQCELVMADSGRAAITALDQKKFDVIFLDLDMPGMNGFDVLSEYLKKRQEGASEKNVIAMTLKSAQQDIDRASELGIPVMLLKPFTRSDVDKALAQSDACQNNQVSKKTPYLTNQEKIIIMDCPPKRSSRFRFFAESLSFDIPQDIERMINEGSDCLIIKVSDGLLDNPVVREHFLSLVWFVLKRRIGLRFVAESTESLALLRKLTETASIPMDISMECALNAVK